MFQMLRFGRPCGPTSVAPGSPSAGTENNFAAGAPVAKVAVDLVSEGSPGSTERRHAPETGEDRAVGGHLEKGSDVTFLREMPPQRLRRGSYFPTLLEPRRMAEKALTAVIQEAYSARGAWGAKRSTDGIPARPLTRYSRRR